MTHDMANFAAAHRNRWLAVLIRHDIESQDVKCDAYGLGNVAPWCHDMYRFDHPLELAQMLELTPKLLEVYGNPDLLPLTKRRASLESKRDVLLMRCPGEDQRLATLVSSYSYQHTLSLPHLQKRGIFAELTPKGDGFAFLCPAMWASLLGVVHDLVLPGEVEQIFHALGNAIAVPHAAIALLGMTSNLDLKLSDCDIADILVQLWSDRLTAFNAIIVKDGDGFVMIRSTAFLRNPTLLRHDIVIHDDWDSEWTFLWPDSSPVCIRAHGTCSVNDLLAILGFPHHILHQWAIAGETFPGIFHGTDFIPFMVSSFTVLFVPLIFQDDACESPNQVDPTQPWSQLPSGIMNEVAENVRLHCRTLEVVMLDNSTRFVICQHGETIRVALQKCKLPEELIELVHPLCNGKKISIDTDIQNLESDLIRLSATPLRGGTRGSQPLQPLMSDPWSNFKPTSNNGTTSVRWEELLLPLDHPWHGEGDKRIAQVSFLQLGPEVGGVAFVSKQNLVKALSTSPPSSTLLLVPALRDLGFKDQTLKDACLPVQQIIVREPNGKTYKRVVLPIVIRKPVSFKIAESTQTVAITSSNFCELVSEVHDAMVTAPTAEALSEQPLEFFRKYIGAVKIPLVELSCYAYRKVKAKDGHTIHQALLKIPEENRKALLQLSGSDEVFIRQFIHGDEKVDHSVLPRYFSLTSQDARQAKQLGEAIGDSFFGLALTARGICIRCSNTGLKDARAAILQRDVRFTDANRHIVCKHYFVAQGFPFNMSHSAIINAVLKATSKPAIPMRSFKVAGLLSWVLAFDEIPSQPIFTFKIGDQSYEVLLMPQDQVKQNKPVKTKGPAAAKPKLNGGLQTAPSPALPASSSNASEADKRIQVLENKVANLETAHTHLASRVETRFDDVSDQLKKVLACVAPKPGRAHDPTGETPPPTKHQKS